MRRLLWCGDACVASGFARATHYTLDVLRQSWEVHVLGINYQGDPHEYPYKVYPCQPGGDPFGIGRMASMLDHVKPNVIIVQNDPWNLPAYMAKANNVPVVAALAVDGKNCAGRGLNGLALAIFWTKFGEQEARLGGYTGQSAVVPLGVDLDIYKPADKKEAREALGLSGKYKDAFIIGNVNRNQPRKRLDLCVAYFAEWVKTRKVDDAFFFFHTAPTGEQGYDIRQLVRYYGIAGRFLIAEPEIGQGVKEHELVHVYNSFDAQMTCTQGEGFGLTTFEGMACGVPQIVPDWAGLGELCEDAAIKVPCTSTACTPNGINVVGGVMDREMAIEALDVVYRDSKLRQRMRKRGFEVVKQPRYRWPNIGKAFGKAVDSALCPELIKSTERCAV